MKKILFSSSIIILLLLTSCSFNFSDNDEPIDNLDASLINDINEIEELSDNSESKDKLSDFVNELDEDLTDEEMEDLEEALAETEKTTNLTIKAGGEKEILRTSTTHQVIWGKIQDASKVAKIKVNGFILQKYQPGDKAFSYIASEKIGTLKNGVNNYEIEALDKDGNTLEKTEYVIISDGKYKQLPNSGPLETLIIALMVSFVSALGLTRRRA